MKTALAIRHLHFEDLGALRPLLHEGGYSVRYLEAASDDLHIQEEPDLLVVLGGPIAAFDEREYPFLLDELALIQRQLQRRLPLLGICLGAQLIARALGAEVASMGLKEIGFAPLTLTAQGRAGLLRWLAWSRCRCCIGTATALRFPRERRLWPGPRCARIKHSASVSMCSRCSAIWRRSRSRSNSGWSDMPVSLPRPVSILVYCAGRPRPRHRACHWQRGRYLALGWMRCQAGSGVEHSTEQLKHRSNCHV
ncbi:gamma-glutamyl-gamma-aminobutyrate hydrolase family protein [uncultured Stenotrophomonas sp.]|uniref:glutamine amidotransferase-related protein n=1 Tax=uncultured Stenotrophomonas sp. TaxID=165438 RepID=UPI0025FE1646|nr:gamma-glutamyl-gamma-aminobutyrate hydrolase family protein [uncultured Stenotrophomonas sp.]